MYVCRLSSEDEALSVCLSLLVVACVVARRDSHSHTYARAGMWIDGLFVGYGWIGGWVDGWMDGWMDGWVDGWVNGWVGEWMD